MFAVFRSLSLRYLLLRWERAALVIISIALGVATLVSTRILNQVLEAAAHESMSPLQQADLMVNNGELRVLRGIATEIKNAKIPDVEAVVPLVFEQARLPEFPEKDGRPITLLGIDPDDFLNLKTDGRPTFNIEILNRKLAFSGTGVFISENLYREREALGEAPNAPLVIRFAQTQHPFPIAGYLVPDKGTATGSIGRNIVAMSLDQSMKLLEPELPTGLIYAAGGVSAGVPIVQQKVTRIDIFVKKGADVARVQAAVSVVVGHRSPVQTPEQAEKSTEDAISSIKIGLSLCSAGAMVVGLFLVYNSLAVSVAERRHDIGVLRSVGATRFQIAKLFTGEAILLGFAGAIVGIPLGKLLANIMLWMVRDDLNSMFLNGDIQPKQLSWLTAITAIAAGMLTALFAALIPAIQAASDEPADAVRRAPSSANRIFRWLHRIACLTLFLGGIGIILLRDKLPVRLGGNVGMVLSLIGLFLAMPFFVRWTTTLMQPIFHRWFGIEARLAADNLLRAPGRTGVVIGALAAGVSLMFQTAGVVRSNEEPIQRWVDQVIQADAFVFWGNLTAANSSMTPMDPNLGAEIVANVPNVERTVGIRFVRPEFRGTIICLAAMDAQDYYEGTRSRLPKPLDGLAHFQELPLGNNVVISENFSVKFHVKVGDTITLPSPKVGPVELKVVGVGQDYTWTKGTVFLDRARYRELFDDPWVDIYHVYFTKGTDKTQGFNDLRNFTASKKLEQADRAAIRDYLAGIIDKIKTLAYMQQILVGLVAALGVVTALLISVLQRQRELGLLRAVGATQLQVLRTVLAEATLIGIIGTLLGIALGLPMEWYLLRVLLYEESGFFFEVIVPWKESLGIGLIAVSIATIAGLIPAIRAVRLGITDAIAYE